MLTLSKAYLKTFLLQLAQIHYFPPFHVPLGQFKILGHLSHSSLQLLLICVCHCPSCVNNCSFNFLITTLRILWSLLWSMFEQRGHKLLISGLLHTQSLRGRTKMPKIDQFSNLYHNYKFHYPQGKGFDYRKGPNLVYIVYVQNT